MPRYGSRRRRTTRRRYFKSLRRTRPSRLAFGRGSVRPTRSTVRMVRAVGRLAEKKYKSLVINEWVSWDGKLLLPVVIEQGVHRYDRVGQKIFCRYLTWNIQVHVSNTTSGSNVTGMYNQGFIRYSIVWPKDIDDEAIANTPHNDPAEPWDISRYTVIKDRIKLVQAPYPINFTVTGGINLQNQGYAPSTFWLRLKVRVYKTVHFNDAGDRLTPLPCVYFYANTSSFNFVNVNGQNMLTFTDV